MKRDDGSGTLEYVGMVTLAALLVIVTATAVTGHASSVAAKAQCAVASVTGLGGCPTGVSAVVAGASGSPPGAVPGPTSADPDRRDTERDARGNRRDDARPGGGDQSGPAPGGTQGGDPYPGGVGPGTPGTHVPLPGAPTWTPSDPGAGEHGSEGAGVKDHALKLAVESAANALTARWPHAARNLLHFLGDSGDPIAQDVDAMLADVPGLAQAVDESVALRLGPAAVAAARAAGATGPITFPIDTAWTGYYIDQGQSADWFYALGGISWNQTGQVTVYPPAAPGGAWTFAANTEVNIRDRYNWDGGKATQIGPVTITDETLAGLHRKGLAQEFTVTGTSGPQTTKGQVP